MSGHCYFFIKEGRHIKVTYDRSLSPILMQAYLETRGKSIPHIPGVSWVPLTSLPHSIGSPPCRARYPGQSSPSSSSGSLLIPWLATCREQGPNRPQVTSLDDLKLGGVRCAGTSISPEIQVRIHCLVLHLSLPPSLHSPSTSLQPSCPLDKSLLPSLPTVPVLSSGPLSHMLRLTPI
jgi:hypothetical protein